MKVAHDSIFGGRLEIKKTKDRIQTNFYWPDLQGDVTSFCRSCDVCQKTTAKGSESECALYGKCQTKLIVYKPSITGPSIPTRHNIEFCETNFKTRFYNHRSSFKDYKR